MPTKTSTAALVLGLLLSFSVAVLGSAFAPSSQAARTIPTQTHSYSPHTTLYNKNDADTGDNDDTPESSIVANSFRGGGTTTLPGTMPALPTMGDFRKFALPCLALWVSGPL